MSIKNFAVRTVAVLALCGAATTLAGGLANAATPTAAPQSLITADITAGSLIHGSTGITMTIVNNTGEDLTLIGASNPYGHWQHQATSMTAGQGPQTVSDYSDNIEGAQIELTFRADDGTVITLQSNARLSGPSTAWAESSSPNHTIAVEHSGSFHTHDTYTIC